MSDRPPPTREELAASLAVNAAGKPLNLAVGVVAFVVVLLVGAPAFVALLVALVLYTLAVGRTMFDGDEAERVTRKQQAARRGGGDEQPPAPPDPS